uniref:Uncharacterized protein n=1 Tax=Oryza glaberrima TaxID=4538 RepID=A0A679BE74_ORYGL|nr:hypothetical protein [Oryza glaberrima]
MAGWLCTLLRSWERGSGGSGGGGGDDDGEHEHKYTTERVKERRHRQYLFFLN